jgi:hypothetical protein
MHIDQSNNLILSEEDKEKIVAAKQTFKELNDLIQEILKSPKESNLKSILSYRYYDSLYSKYRNIGVRTMRVSLEDITFMENTDIKSGICIDYMPDTCSCCTEAKTKLITFEEIDDPINLN